MVIFWLFGYSVPLPNKLPNHRQTNRQTNCQTNCQTLTVYPYIHHPRTGWSGGVAGRRQGPRVLRPRSATRRRRYVYFLIHRWAIRALTGKCFIYSQTSPSPPSLSPPSVEEAVDDRCETSLLCALVSASGEWHSGQLCIARISRVNARRLHVLHFVVRESSRMGLPDAMHHF